MLADDNWATFAGFSVFREKQNPVSEHSRPHIQHQLISNKLRLIENEASARIGRQARIGDTSDDFLPNVVPAEARCFFPALGGRSVCFFPELASTIGRLPNQCLGVVHHLVELPLQSESRVFFKRTT